MLLTNFILFFFLFILTFPALGKANAFDDFVKQSSKPELQLMSDRIDARIYGIENLVELHNEAIWGRKPEYIKSDLLVLFNSIEDSSIQFNSLLQKVNLDTPECRRFYRLDRENNLKLLQRLKDALEAPRNLSPILEAQIRILFLQKQQLYSLSSMGADGGMSLIMKQPVSCKTVNSIRTQVDEIKQKRLQDIISFINLRFGQEGLKSSFSLTNQLSKMSQKKLKKERNQMFTEFVALSAIAFVGIEIGLFKGLTDLVKIGKLTARASKLIKGSTYLLLTGYSAVTTIDLMKPLLKPDMPKLSMSDWEGSLDSFEGYLYDEPNAPEILNLLIANIQLAHHEQIGKSLKEVYDSYALSIRKWGDKDSALTEYKRKQTVIEDAINKINYKNNINSASLTN